MKIEWRFVGLKDSCLIVTKLNTVAYSAATFKIPEYLIWGTKKSKHAAHILSKRLKVRKVF
jgi:hypothetical protein